MNLLFFFVYVLLQFFVNSSMPSHSPSHFQIYRESASPESHAGGASGRPASPEFSITVSQSSLPTKYNRLAKAMILAAMKAHTPRGHPLHDWLRTETQAMVRGLSNTRILSRLRLLQRDDRSNSFNTMKGLHRSTSVRRSLFHIDILTPKTTTTTLTGQEAAILLYRVSTLASLRPLTSSPR